MLKKLIIVLLISFPYALLAQNNTLTGNIFDNDSRTTTLQGATIRNLSNKNIALADKDGHFAITAKVGDLISFGMVGYQTDTVYLTNLFPKNIFLRMEVNNLKTVDINSIKVSPYLNTKDPEATPARRVDYSKERGGLRFNLGYGKYRREQAKIQELEERAKINDEISKNFSEEFIRAVVKFEGPDIKSFMALYRPTVEEVKAETPFNYTMYTIKAYRVWQKLPPDQRKLPPLPKLTTN